MKFFGDARYAVIVVVLAATACAAPTQMSAVGVAPAFPELIATGVWQPAGPFPMHDVVELEITSVDEGGSGRGVIRSLVVSESPVRVTARRDRAVLSVNLHAGGIAFDLQYLLIRVRTDGGGFKEVPALAGSVSGYPDLPRLEPRLAAFFRSRSE